jgi:hypothetical protein
MPSTVGTSTSEYSIRTSMQRKTFYANDRHWVFYSNGTDMVYRTSLDGLTWSDATVVKACPYGYEFSIWYDGTYVYYVHGRGSPAPTLIYFRRGIISGGTIIWEAERLALDTTDWGGGTAQQLIVIVDSEGYPWIGLTYVPKTSYFGVNALQSLTKDGSGAWTNHVLNLPVQQTYYGHQIVPLTGGKVYVSYGYNSVPRLRGMLWDGAVWGGVETIDSSTVGVVFTFPCFSAVAQRDDVSILYLNPVDAHSYYRKRTYGVGWGAGEDITQLYGADASPVLSLGTALNYLLAFRHKPVTGGAGLSYYKRYVEGVWDAANTELFYELDGITSGTAISCSYQPYDGIIGILYSSRTSSPYNVRYAYLSPGKIRRFQVEGSDFQETKFG